MLLRTAGHREIDPSASLGRAVAEKYQAVYAADKTHNLIVRLRHNVIRAGLRRINMAYSRISLQDVATKLGDPRITFLPPPLCSHRIIPTQF